MATLGVTFPLGAVLQTVTAQNNGAATGVMNGSFDADMAQMPSKTKKTEKL